ncbi:cytochrome P450 3A6-like [Littorina saxatilis]|uniref:cytochrome P450 3A6-like n=1 Tax=Littorina saxatilis TaxID=31220 RepID=UPI0038B67AC7
MEEETEGCLSLASWLIIGAVTLLLLWAWKACRVYNTFTAMGVPGPKPIPLMGNLLDTFKYGIVEQFARYGRQYGHIYGIFTFTKPMLLVTDLDMAREIFVKKFHSFPDRLTEGSMNSKPWKDVLTHLKGDHWKHVRSQLSPIFSSGKLKRMMPAIQRVTVTLTEYLKKAAEKGEAIELKGLCGRFSMDVFAGVAFSIELDSIHNPDDKFVKRAAVIMNPNKVVMTLLLFAPRLFWFLSKYGLDMGFKESLDFFLAVSESAAKDCGQDKERRTDFVRLLVEAQEEETKGAVDAEINHQDQLVTSSTWSQKGLTADEIHANAFLFLLAGYETVATVTSFTFFLLAVNPECQKKAQEEVDKILGKTKVDYESANLLTYLDMCINEAMRLYPPAFM